MTMENKPTWSDPGPSWRELQGGKLELGDTPESDWDELGRRRRSLRRAAITMAGWLPFSFVVALVGLGIVFPLGRDPEIGNAVNNGVFLLSVAYMVPAYLWLIVSWHRLRNWRCPLCDWLYFDPPPFAFWFTRIDCAHCGAKLPQWYTRR